MSKKLAEPPAGRARTLAMPVEPANAAPTQPEACGNYHESAESELQAVPGPGMVGDGAETSISAMAAHEAHQRHVSYILPAIDAGEDAEHRRMAEPRGHGDAGYITQGVAARSRPFYVPPSMRRREEPASAESELKALPGPGVVGDGAETSISAMAAQEDAEHRSTAEPRGHGGAGYITRMAARCRPVYVPPSMRRRDELASHFGPGGLPLPPPGHAGSTYAPPRRVGRLPNIERVTPEGIIMDALSAPSSVGLPRLPEQAPRRVLPRSIITLVKKKHPEAALYFTACCLLSCLLALAIGFALMVVYLRYHPQPPRMRVTTATLKNSTLGGRVTNYSLSIQAHIVNPNTELHIVLRYVQLDLYFQGSLVGTQAVWPAPIHEAPGDSVLRSAHLLVSVTQEHDVLAWQNATNESGGIKPLVELLLVGRFHSQLNFGRRLPFRFWVYPRCTLWLDPLRGGALRQSWC